MVKITLVTAKKAGLNTQLPNHNATNPRVADAMPRTAGAIHAPQAQNYPTTAVSPFHHIVVNKKTS